MCQSGMTDRRNFEQTIGEPTRPLARFAVVLREAQWELDRIAFLLPRDEVSATEREALADTLVELAELLRTGP